MREQLIKKAEIFPIEFIVHNVTGSLTKRLGIPEDGLEKPLLEYCYERWITGSFNFKRTYFSFGWATEKEIIEIDKMTLRINDLLAGMFRGIGIKLVDFKIEYGKAWNKDNEKKEIHWQMKLVLILVDVGFKNWKKLDKDRFRKI